MDLPKSLTEMPARDEHQRWAELTGDSSIESLRFTILGHVNKLQERVQGGTWWTAFCVLLSGEGTFREPGTNVTKVVSAPGIFFTSPDVASDYGPHLGRPWEECYWTLDGSRVEEWRRSGWWPSTSQFFSISPENREALWQLFARSVDAVERRDGFAIDGAKLAVEQWLHEFSRTHAPAQSGQISPITSVVEEWRRDPQHRWSLRAAAARVNLSYTRFRSLFVEEYATSPYDYLLRLRLELAERWLATTNEPVKFIAARSGFLRTESFIRAFTRLHGLTPNRWRIKARQAIRSEAEKADKGSAASSRRRLRRR